MLEHEVILTAASGRAIASICRIASVKRGQPWRGGHISLGGRWGAAKSVKSESVSDANLYQADRK